MAKRGIHINTWVTEEDREIIRKKAQQAGLSCSRYIRLAALGAEIRQVPPADVPVLINEVRKVGTSLACLIDRKERYRPEVDKMLREALIENFRTERMIREAYINRWQ